MSKLELIINLLESLILPGAVGMLLLRKYGEDTMQDKEVYLVAWVISIILFHILNSIIYKITGDWLISGHLYSTFTHASVKSQKIGNRIYNDMEMATTPIDQQTQETQQEETITLPIVPPLSQVPEDSPPPTHPLPLQEYVDAQHQVEQNQQDQGIY